MVRTWIASGALVLGLMAAAVAPAAAQLPDAEAFLKDVGFSPDEIAKAKAGQIVHGTLKPSNERELGATFAFVVKETPSNLVNEAKAGLLNKVDPNAIAFQVIEGASGLASFARLGLEPDASQRAQAYVAAKPGGDLNLSAQEIATFNELGSGAAPAAVEQAVRSALLARLQAYQSKGLAGIAPYARSGGKQRPPADDLRSATRAMEKLQARVPAAYRMLLDYPQSKPPGTEETYRWFHFRAHDVPTIALTHTFYIPDGDAWVVGQRQFYVSAGYNCEQALAAFIPVKAGTAVVYANRTSTDQVVGFGGGAKRSIGSKLLASQLQGLFAKISGGKGGG